jgi:hypothetical protein
MGECKVGDKQPENSNLSYDYTLGRVLFERQKRIVARYNGGLYIALTQGPCTQSSPLEISRFEPELRGAEPGAEVPLTTVCRLEYHVAGFEHPFAERLGKFGNVISLDNVLEGIHELKAGDIQADMINQVALRLEEIYGITSKEGRTLEMSLGREQRTIVTPEIISLMKFPALPQEIAFLRDRNKKIRVYASGSGHSDEFGTAL